MQPFWMQLMLLRRQRNATYEIFKKNWKIWRFGCSKFKNSKSPKNPDVGVLCRRFESYNIGHIRVNYKHKKVAYRGVQKNNPQLKSTKICSWENTVCRDTELLLRPNLFKNVKSIFDKDADFDDNSTRSNGMTFRHTFGWRVECHLHFWQKRNSMNLINPRHDWRSFLIDQLSKETCDLLCPNQEDREFSEPRVWARSRPRFLLP